MAKIKFMFSCVTFYQFMLLRKDLGKRLVVTDGIIYPIVFQIIFYSVYVWRANLCATFLGNLVYPTPASKMLHFP